MQCLSIYETLKCIRYIVNGKHTCNYTSEKISTVHYKPRAVHRLHHPADIMPFSLKELQCYLRKTLTNKEKKKICDKNLQNTLQYRNG